MTLFKPYLMVAFAALAGLSATVSQAEEQAARAKVTGIGGVFFLSDDGGKKLSSWYEQHLGLKLETWGGAVLQWQDDTASDNGVTVWGTAKTDSDWFAPSKSPFMINYRIDNMQRMLEQLTAAGIEILDGPEYAENGVFAWIMDPNGNKIELWEPKLWDDKNKR